MALHSHSKIMVFRPMLEDMKDFDRYIRHMESAGADRFGAAKVGARVFGTGYA